MVEHRPPSKVIRGVGAPHQHPFGGSVASYLCHFIANVRLHIPITYNTDAGQPSVQTLGIGDVLFGEKVPAGRLIQTVYPKAYGDEVSIFDFNMRPGQ